MMTCACCKGSTKKLFLDWVQIETCSTVSRYICAVCYDTKHGVGSSQYEHNAITVTGDVFIPGTVQLTSEYFVAGTITL
jgi:hypothetical protein